MNYEKLQLSYILLMLMCVIQLLTNLFILHKMWLTITSIGVLLLCILGFIYTLYKASPKHSSPPKQQSKK